MQKVDSHETNGHNLSCCVLATQKIYSTLPHTKHKPADKEDVAARKVVRLKME